MVRTQIQLTENQVRRLRDQARQEGRSMADLIRESVERYINVPTVVDVAESKRRAPEAVGRFRSGYSDIAVNHDRYLAKDHR